MYAQNNFGWVQLVGAALSAAGSAYGKNKAKKASAAAAQMDVLAALKEQKIAESNAKIAAAQSQLQANRILGLPKNVFFALTGVTIVITGIGIYFVMKK